MQETRLQSLDQEDPLEKEMANRSSTPAWKIPWTEEPGPWSCKESDTTERIHFHFQSLSSQNILCSVKTLHTLHNTAFIHHGSAAS